MHTMARGALQRLGLLALGWAVALPLGEAALRVFDIGPRLLPIESSLLRLSRNPRLRYEWKPGAHLNGVQINSDGMRDRARDRAKKAGLLRIACVGDSICAGYSVASQASFPSQLESLSNGVLACDGCVEALNFGVPGYDLEQIVESLDSSALAFRPDLVIYGYCLNDPQAFSLELAQLQSRLDPAARSYVDGVWAESLRPLRHSRLLLLTRWFMNATFFPASPRSGYVSRRADPQVRAYDAGRLAGYLRWLHEDADSWKTVRENLGRMERLTRRHDIPVLIVIFPLLSELEHYTLDDVHARLRAEIESRSLSVLDLTQPFRNLVRLGGPSLEVLHDPIHPGIAGHRLAAWALLEKLSDMDLVHVGSAELLGGATAMTAVDSACLAAIR